MSGFRRGCSSIYNVIDLVSNVQDMRARYQVTVAPFINAKGAFDATDHGAVLPSLSTIGITWRPLLWILNYLRERKVYILTPGGDSSQHIVSRVAPHGGVLSPILFNLTLLRIILLILGTVRISIYAIDSCVWCSCISVRVIRGWLQKYVAKSLLPPQVLFTPVTWEVGCVSFYEKMHFKISHFYGWCISYVIEHAFSGVTLYRSLSWMPHVKRVQTKLGSFVLVKVVARGGDHQS